MRNNRKRIGGLRMMSYAIFAWFMIFPIILFMVVSPSCSILPKKSPAKYIEIGTDYYSKKNYSRAYKNYTKAIDANKFYAKAYWMRATIGTLIDSSEKSIRDWSMFIAFSKNADSLCTAHYNRGNLMFKQGYKPDACIDWQKSIDLNGKSSNKSGDQLRLCCK